MFYRHNTIIHGGVSYTTRARNFMKIFYVYAHPNPSSFNGLLKNTALELLQTLSVDIQQSDLYAQHFKAVASWDDFDITMKTESHYFLAQQAAFQENSLSEDITFELEKIRWADHIIFQFPLWWFSVPAILKGWFDRILVKGFAYDSGQIFQEGLLKGKTASLSVTTQSPENAYQTNGAHAATIDTFLHHIHHTLRFVGIKTLPPFVTYAAFHLEAERKEKIIADYQAYLRKFSE